MSRRQGKEMIVCNVLGSEYSGRSSTGHTYMDQTPMQIFSRSSSEGREHGSLGAIDVEERE